jgi:hypothetical protein
MPVRLALVCAGIEIVAKNDERLFLFVAEFIHESLMNQSIQLVGGSSPGPKTNVLDA